MKHGTVFDLSTIFQTEKIYPKKEIYLCLKNKTCRQLSLDDVILKKGLLKICKVLIPTRATTLPPKRTYYWYCIMTGSKL
jgi:hypothetical protein